MSARATWDRHLGRAVDAAIRNVLGFGDTDLFPDPLESRWIAQAPRRAREAVIELHRRMDSGHPGKPETLRALFPAGPAGYRLGSQIDPVWNLYLLSLVILAGPAIESARQPRERQSVFSFRFTDPDERGRIFDPQSGWRAFTQRTLDLAGAHAQVVVCDIADFYHRVDVSMARAALMRAGVAPALTRRIARVLQALQADRVGLPIGGPASRLIAEAVLCEIDDLLVAAGWIFCRFVDDIRLFAPNEAQARKGLTLLSGELLKRGLSLQKSKSRIVPGPELTEQLSVGQGLQLEPTKGGASAAVSTDLRRLLLAPAVFDPYSGLRAQRDVRLEQFGQHAQALPLLRREFSKSRVNPALARNLLSALAYMPGADAEQAILFLLDVRRQDVVLPVVGKLLAVALEQGRRLDAAAQGRLRDALLALLARDAMLLHLPSSRAQALRVLQTLPPDGAPDGGDTTRALLSRLYADSREPLVRRELLWLWGVWGLPDELREAARSARQLGGWERRALVGACACLGLTAPPSAVRFAVRDPLCDREWVRWVSTLSPKRARSKLAQWAPDAV